MNRYMCINRTRIKYQLFGELNQNSPKYEKKLFITINIVIN